jgi:nucleoid-associated protein YgaU
MNGHADAERDIYLYLDNDFIGQTRSDNDGGWQLRPSRQIAPGLYTLRVDQVDQAGKVMARISLPLARAEPLADLPSEPFVVVQPGNSLWRLARRTYGSGVSYTIIYEANREQIQDADLIYPGQIFALPATN